MTGQRQLAYKHEDGYLGDPTDTTFKRLGLEPSVEDLSFEQGLERMGLPTDAQTVQTVAQNFEGALSVSFVPSGEPWYHDHVMGTTPTAGGESSAPHSYTWTPTLGAIPSARFYAGADYLNGTAEREIMGAVFGSLSIDFSVGEQVRMTLTGMYGDEQSNTSLSPSSLPEPAGSPLVYHSGHLQIPGGAGLTKIQSGTLDIQSNARFQREAFSGSRKPVAAVAGNFETSLDLTRIVNNTDQLALAYGGAPSDDTTSVQTTAAGAADGSLKFTTPGTNSLAYPLTRVTPNSYSWSDLLARDTDLTEDITYIVDEVEAVAESAADTAQ